jgi:pimeloyl-ACP methyl ester carboxylesterase
MTTFVLVPGADGRAWYWHLLGPLLREHGHDLVTMDMPASDDAGYREYADAIVLAIGERRPVTLVAQSIAGFTGTPITELVPVERILLVNAMVPVPGERLADWWDNTGHSMPPDFDLVRDFFHDVPPEVTAEALAGEPGEPSETLFAQPWPLPAWPRVPTRFIQGRDDRFFPAALQRRVVKQRLGIEIEEMPGGHLLALSQPAELARRLVSSTRDTP